MSPIYELIFKHQGQLMTETVQVADASQAWQLGRQRYPHGMRDVVCLDAAAAEPDQQR